MTTALRGRLATVRPSREALAWGSLLVNAELLAVLLYLVVNAHRVTITRPLMLVFPFVWINVGLWAVVRASPSPATTGQRLLGAAVAGGYFLVLASVSGLVRPPVDPVLGLSTSVWTVPPGYGPMVFLDTAVVELVFSPYRVIGYAALAYLVYVTVLDASNALVGGVLGLFSCVSCTFPVIAALLTGVAGGGALAETVSANLYLASTAVFVATVALLYWRPDPRRLWR